MIRMLIIGYCMGIRAWDVLMKRLGYARYVSQGGDWGSVIAEAMARQAPEGLLGIHVNLPAAVPLEVGPPLPALGALLPAFPRRKARHSKGCAPSSAAETWLTRQ